MKQKITKKHVFVLLVVISIFVYLFSGDLLQRIKVTSVGFLFLMVAYAFGFLSPLIAVFFTIFAFIVSLPLVASVYALIVYALSNIHYFILRTIVKGFLQRIPAYRRMEMKVKNSRAYRSMKDRMNKFSKDTGIMEPRKMRFIELRSCDKCEKYIPGDSKYCSYCGTEQWV